MKCFVTNLFAESVNSDGIENKSNACQWKADWTIKPVFYIQYPEKICSLVKTEFNIISLFNSNDNYVFYYFTISGRVSVLGVKSLGGHFACLCRELNF